MAAENLLDQVYEELRRLAASKMSREAPGQTLQPTALVHEAWLRPVGTQSTGHCEITPVFSLPAARRGHAADTHRPRLPASSGSVMAVALNGSMWIN